MFLASNYDPEGKKSKRAFLIPEESTQHRPKDNQNCNKISLIKIESKVIILFESCFQSVSIIE